MLHCHFRVSCAVGDVYYTRQHLQVARLQGSHFFGGLDSFLELVLAGEQQGQFQQARAPVGSHRHTAAQGFERAVDVAGLLCHQACEHEDPGVIGQLFLCLVQRESGLLEIALGDQRAGGFEVLAVGVGHSGGGAHEGIKGKDLRETVGCHAVDMRQLPLIPRLSRIHDAACRRV